MAGNKGTLQQATVTLTTAAAAATPTASRLFNLTRLPSADELIHLPLRVAGRLDRFVSRAWHGGNVATATMADGVQAAQQMAAGDAGAATTWAQAFGEAFQLSNIKSYWGMVHYLTSRWAFTTFTMSLILNRVTVYGSTRHRIFLTWDKRLALRIIPILLLVAQILSLLQAIQCQTSPDFSMYRYGSPDKYNPLDWVSDSTFLRVLSSKLTFSTDSNSCAAIGMSRIGEVRPRSGSFALLWPTFLRLCLSQFVETFSCALQQQSVMTDVGMSVFEHSLAFAETENMIAQMLGLGLFRSTASISPANAANMTLVPSSATTRAFSDAATSLTSPHLLDRLNIPTEVLLIALLSCCNSLTANVIAIFNRQRSLRLINTGFWGFGFMSTFIWGFFSHTSRVYAGNFGSAGGGNVVVSTRNTSAIRPFSTVGSRINVTDLRPVNGLLHFPTVCMVGFVPHLVVLLGIMVCIGIYLLALMLTVLSLETNSFIPAASTLRQKVRIAHENLQAAVQVRGIRIKWDEDIYTALLRLGFTALTAASEAVFLNEGRSVEVRQFSWLEEDRLDEIESSAWPAGRPSILSSSFQISEEYGLPSGAEGTDTPESGYAKERKHDRDSKKGEKDANGVIMYPNHPPDGVGAIQRTTRFYLLFIFMRGIYFLIGGWIAYGTGVLLDRIGFTRRPSWLRKIIGKSRKKEAARNEKAIVKGKSKSLDFWLLTESGDLAIPRSDDLDIEREMRRRLTMENGSDSVEEVLDDRLYSWWKMGGWWGTTDSSGSYVPTEDNEDITSVVSMSETASTTDEDEDRDWQSESDGRRTPTQHSFGLDYDPRKSIPAPFTDTPLDAAALARLLSQPDQASKEEARMLAAHLNPKSESQMVTRSRYREELETNRARVLLAGRYHPTAVGGSGAKRLLTSAEEADVLEELILARRRARKVGESRPPGPTSETEAEVGPVCVVCQSQGRTIIAWPCRCLCVCEDCRVSLAMNNFSNCVTCRRGVTGFVRLWVP